MNPRQRIYFGDLTEQKTGKKPQLLWKDFDFSDHSLDPDTLVPEKPKEEEEDLDLLESDNEEEKQEDEIDELTKKFQENDKSTANGKMQKHQGKKSHSLLVFAINMEKNEKEKSDKSHFYRSLDQHKVQDFG